MAKKKVHFNQLYPWDRWFSEDVFTVRRYEEYHCQPQGMVRNIVQAAKRHKVRVSIAQDGTDIVVAVTERGIE